MAGRGRPGQPPLTSRVPLGMSLGIHPRARLCSSVSRGTGGDCYPFAGAFCGYYLAHGVGGQCLLNTDSPLWAEKGSGDRTGRGLKVPTRPAVPHDPAICPLTPLGLAWGCADLSSALASSPQPLRSVAPGYLLVMVVVRGEGVALSVPRSPRRSPGLTWSSLGSSLRGAAETRLSPDGDSVLPPPPAHLPPLQFQVTLAPL